MRLRKEPTVRPKDSPCIGCQCDHECRYSCDFFDGWFSRRWRMAQANAAKLKFMEEHYLCNFLKRK